MTSHDMRDDDDDDDDDDEDEEEEDDDDDDDNDYDAVAVDDHMSIKRWYRGCPMVWVHASIS